VAEGLRALPGVTGVDELGAQDGRTRATITAAGDVDLRPAIYRLAVERGWTLYELYQEGGSLEELFRQLTTEGGRA
jgi:ABC-2 type transport system ATP-binding protein